MRLGLDRDILNSIDLILINEMATEAEVPVLGSVKAPAAPAPVEEMPVDSGEAEIPDWLRGLTPADTKLVSPDAPTAPHQNLEAPVAPAGNEGDGGESPEALQTWSPEVVTAGSPLPPGIAIEVPVAAGELPVAGAEIPQPLTSDELRRYRESLLGKTVTGVGDRVKGAIEARRRRSAEMAAEPKERKSLLERARGLRDRINAAGARVNEFAERVAAQARQTGGEPVEPLTSEELQRRWRESSFGRVGTRVSALGERAGQAAVGQAAAGEAVEAYKAKVAAEAETARLAEEQKLAGERKAEADRTVAEQEQRGAEEATRLEKARQQAEARRQRYEALKTKALDDNQVESLVRGVVGRDADGQRSAAGMLEDAAQVIGNELAAAQQKELAVREGINQAQELMRRREAELEQQKQVKLEELKTNAEERLQLPGMRAELGRVGVSLEQVNAELNRYLEMPARLQKTYAGEIARLKAEKAGFTAKKNGLNRTVTQLETKVAKFVEAQTPEVETWHQTQLLQAGREVQALVDMQEGYDKADVEVWVRMELDTTIHEAGVALDNLERWQELAADPENIAKQIAEVQAQQDMLVAGIENRITGLNGDVARFTENLAEAKEIQKRAKSERAKDRAKIEVKRAEVALADAQAELDKANKELKRAGKTRKAAVDAKRSELLPAELLEEDGVNYGGEVAVTTYEGETNIVSLVDVVRGNRGRRKEVARTEAATPVGRLAEFVVWGGEAMEPDENGNLVPVKVKGLYEREAMSFAGRLEAETEMARQRLERQAGGETKEAEDVNVEISRALEQAGEGARKAVELVIKASGDNQLENISAENKKRLGEMVGSINTEMVNQAASLAAEAMAGKTPEVQQKIGNWVGAMEMILANAPAEAGNLAGLRQLAETLKKFAP